MRRLQQFEGFQIGKRITSFNPFEQELAATGGEGTVALFTSKSKDSITHFVNILGAAPTSGTALQLRPKSEPEPENKPDPQPEPRSKPKPSLLNVLEAPDTAPIVSTLCLFPTATATATAPMKKRNEVVAMNEEGNTIPMIQPRDKEGKRLLYKHPNLPTVGPRGAYWLLVGSSDKSSQAWLLQFDGAANPNPGPASSGAVLYSPPHLDGERRVVFESGKFLGKATNNIAEVQGLLLGLQIAAARGARELLIEGDSELIIFHQTGKYKVSDKKLKVWWSEIQAAMMDETCFDWIAIRQVPREQNERADSITKDVLRTRSNFTR